MFHPPRDSVPWALPNLVNERCANTVSAIAALADSLTRLQRQPLNGRAIQRCSRKQQYFDVLDAAARLMKLSISVVILAL